jgi:hypothetical protein
MGCSSNASRRGARNPPAARPARLPARALHSALLGPCSLGEAIPRAPSLHRGGRHQARRPRLERGDAPARGTRRGSTEGMAPWRHLTNRRKNPGRARDGRWRSPPSHRTSRTRDGWEHPRRENEVARSPVSTRDGEDHPGRYRLRKQLSGRGRQRSCRWVTTGRSLASGQPPGEGERGQRREPRAEEDSRLAGVPARRNALQISVGSRKPREARLKLLVTSPKGDQPGALHRPPRSGSRRAGGGSVEGEPLGRHRKVLARALSTTK